MRFGTRNHYAGRTCNNLAARVSQSVSEDLVSELEDCCYAVVSCRYEKLVAETRKSYGDQEKWTSAVGSRYQRLVKTWQAEKSKVYAIVN
jgi:hypothetical protein